MIFKTSRLFNNRGYWFLTRYHGLIFFPLDTFLRLKMLLISNCHVDQSPPTCINAIIVKMQTASVCAIRPFIVHNAPSETVLRPDVFIRKSVATSHKNRLVSASR